MTDESITAAGRRQLGIRVARRTFWELAAWVLVSIVVLALVVWGLDIPNPHEPALMALAILIGISRLVYLALTAASRRMHTNTRLRALASLTGALGLVTVVRALVEYSGLAALLVESELSQGAGAIEAAGSVVWLARFAVLTDARVRVAFYVGVPALLVALAVDVARRVYVRRENHA